MKHETIAKLRKAGLRLDGNKVVAGPRRHAGPPGMDEEPVAQQIIDILTYAAGDCRSAANQLEQKIKAYKKLIKDDKAASKAWKKEYPTLMESLENDFNYIKEQLEDIQYI